MFTVIGTTYGSGNGSTTFNLPNLTDKFVQGSATSGIVKSAGLPNITGSFDLLIANNAHIRPDVVSGAFSKSSNYGYISSGGITGSVSEPGQIDFSASRSNSIYGNSTTVQPPALTMRFAIFAGHTDLYRWIRKS